MTTAVNSFEFDTLYGYNGEEITALPNGEYCHPAGIGILCKTAKNPGHWVPFTEKYGKEIGKICFNKKLRMMVVSEKRLSVALSVFSWPERKLLQKIPEVAKLGLSDMTFSRDGTLFATLTDAPHHIITIYAVEANRENRREPFSQLYTQKDPSEHAFKYINFNPRNKYELCTSGGGHVAFWTFDREPVVALVPVQGEVPRKIVHPAPIDPNSTETGEVLPKSSPAVIITVHQWSPLGGNGVYCGTTAGDVYVFDAVTGHGNLALPPPAGSQSPVVAMTLSRLHLVVAHQDGVVRFVSFDLAHVVKTINLPTTDLTTLTFTPEWHSMLFGGKDGVVALLNLPEYDNPALNHEEFSMCAERVSILNEGFGQVVGAELIAEDCFAVVGKNGLMRILDHRHNRIESRTDVGAEPTVVLACRQHHCIMTAHANGTLRFFDVTDRAKPKVACRALVLPGKRFKLGCCSRDGQYSVFVTQDNYLVYVDPQRRTVVATAQIPICTVSGSDDKQSDPVWDVAWVSDKSSDGLLISMQSSGVYWIKVPDSQVDLSDELEAPWHQLELNLWRLGVPLVKLVVGANLGDKLTILGAALDRSSYYFSVKTENTQSVEKKTKLTQGKEIGKDEHPKLASYLALVSDKWLVSCGTDGRVVIRDASAFLKATLDPRSTLHEKAWTFTRHVSSMNGVIHFSAGPNGKYLLSVGGDGYIAVFREAAHPRFERGPLTTLPTLAAPPAEPEETLQWLEKKRQEDAELDSAKHKGHREAIKQQILKLQARLREIRVANAEAAEEEQASTSDFLVERSKKRFDKKVQDAIEVMKRETAIANLRSDWISEKLRKERWEVMQVKLTPLIGMRNENLCVHNLHMRQSETKDLLLLRKLKFLRRVEELERHQRGVDTELCDLIEAPGRDDQGTPQPDAPPPDNKSKEKEAEAEEKTLLQIVEAMNDPANQTADGEIEISKPTHKNLETEALEDSINPYLYKPMLCFTRHRAITQIRLLNAKIMRIKHTFNTEFDNLFSRKRNDIGKMSERNERSKHIMKELDEEVELTICQLHKIENPDEILTVKDADVPADKTKDPDEKKRLHQVEEEKERWRRQHGSDDGAERALKAWMDGRLEKEVQKLEVRIQMPEFADKDSDKFIEPDQRSEEQVKALREYEKKKEKMIEEVNNQRRVLAQELAKLQKENKEIAQKFDVELDRLLRKRLQISQDCAAVDLEQVKLAQSVILHKSRAHILKRKEKERQVAARDADRAKVIATRSKGEFDIVVGKRTAKQKEEATEARVQWLEQNKWPEIEHIAQGLMKHYDAAKKKSTKAKKKDEKKKKAVATAPVEDLEVQLDPWSFIERDEEAKDRAAAEEASATTAQVTGREKPDGCPDELWASFMQFVNDRATGAKQLARISMDEAEKKHDYSRLQDREKRLANERNKKERELEEYQHLALREQYDIDQLYLFQQGQVEVEQAPVVTDYEDAILIRASRIEELNEHIRARALERAKLKEQNLLDRHNLKTVMWDIENFQYQSITKEMECKHLQTLRVTKQMQEFINGGGENHNEEQRQKLQQKIEHVRATMASKIEERRQGMQKLKKLTKEKEMENVLLLDQVSQANTLVENRKSIRDLQSSELEKERNDKLMRDMRVTRKLEDVAKAQQDEMTALKKEIDRLRERTFPSFAVVSKRVIGNPDER